MVEKERIEALEYVRQMKGDTEEALEFASFAVGFPPDMDMTERFAAFMFAKYGPAQTSMDTQQPKEFHK